MERHFSDLLKELMGEENQVEFAERTGLGRSTIAMLLAGERKPGRLTIQRLVDAFPERKGDIWRVFLASECHYQDNKSQ